MSVSRQTWINALATIALALGGVWFVRHTEWVDQPVRVPTHGEAARDTHYAIKQILQGLGAKVVAPTNLDRLPPVGATLVLGSWNWDLFPEREQALRRWVEAGGHLVTPQWKRPDWVGIDQKSVRRGAASAPSAAAAPMPRGRPLPVPREAECHDTHEPDAVTPAFATHRRYRLCNGAFNIVLHTQAPVLWSLDGPNGPELLRVAIGRGSATSRLGGLIDNRQVFEGDHALAFVAALRLRSGDEVWFVDTEARPPLLALIWHTGAPAVLLAGLGMALLLWRAAVRFGPLAPEPGLARRSVAEQIRGTASFIFQRDSVALHRAELRALEQAARRRLAHHDRLDRRARAEAIGRATALDAIALARAMDPSLRRARRDLLATLALLETATRRLRLS